MTTSRPKPYVVPTYPVIRHGLPGTDEWARLAGVHSGGALWNNGTWVMRDVRGNAGVISNHARGVAMDLSWRRIEPRKLGVSDGRTKAVKFLQAALDNWDLLGIQCVLDYWPDSQASAYMGRGWRCDRVGSGGNKPHANDAWRKYNTPTIHGAPGGDWFHIEIVRHLAEDPQLVRQAFAKAFTTIPQASATVDGTTESSEGSDDGDSARADDPSGHNPVRGVRGNGTRRTRGDGASVPQKRRRQVDVGTARVPRKQVGDVGDTATS